MYSDPNLDAPPPRSQFRRPWSPEPFDPYAIPSSELYGIPESRFDNRHQHQEQDYHSRGTSPHRQQRREASDVSVEALDLADYARTLRARQAEDPYPAFFPPSQFRQESHPPSSFPALPPAHRNSSRTSFGSQPPSLVSRGGTLSSSATHHTAASVPSRGRHSSRRPFSMPTTPHASAHGSSSRLQYPPSSVHRGPHIVEPEDYASPSDEIDVSHFPKWSRNWYNSNSSSPRYNPDGYNGDADIYNSIPPSQLNTKHKSPFDPGYVHDPYNTFNSDPYSPYDLPPPLSSMSHGSSRDLLPWSSDPPEYGPPLDPMMKEERIRMLEREFGAKAKGKGKDDGRGLTDEEGKPLVGTVDEKGNLVTVGPKKRVFVRTLQVLLAAGACIPVIYASVAIKQPNSKDPPPPANKPPLYVLYLFSSITLLLLLYMFVFRPCCCVRSKSRSSKHPLGAAAHMGMMVLPVGNAGGKKGKKAKEGKKGKGKYGPPGAQDVQVNLIVDPTAFQPPDESDEEDDEEEGSMDEMPGAFDRRDRARRKRRNRHRRRKGFMEGLAMEAEWKKARAWAVKLAVLDGFGVALWGAMFVFIMTGKRCPSGEFNGWCNAYNVSTASACLLCLAFSLSVFFDVQDLHASKQSPRTRTS
ncbi:hypothetical protein CVT26_015990 [Gymnopilus dilepis]|uniref:Uncharacterized protein n=1 Tax=Gymnopilus dilepis TaxID=231916 RepID=A0A409YDN0_9AGAR|nr:hypothetical protein CVT26_015990 [Gymnopilus dilepis]